MVNWKLMGAFGACVVLASCGGGGSGSTSSSNAIEVDLSGSRALPEQMSLVTPTDDSVSANTASRTLGIEAGVSRAVHNTGSFSSTTDYASAPQNVYVELDAVEPISFINDFLCFTGQTLPLEMLDQGDYVVWANANECFDENDGSDNEQGSGTGVPSYVTIVANSSQASEDDPLVLEGWIEDYAGQAGGGPPAIKLLGEVSQVPTDSNPFGVFTLTYGLLPTITAGAADTVGFGEVSSFETTDGGAAFTSYQKDIREDEDSGRTIECITTSSVEYNEETENGIARTGNVCNFQDDGSASSDGGGVYALAVNSTHVLMAQADSYANLGSVPDSAQQCLLRDEYTENVWNYGLFNKANGSAVELTSGIQLKVDSNGDSNFDSWGYVGYWGAWRDAGGTFADGDTVQEATYDDTTGDEYTVLVAPGRLVKNSIEDVLLTDLGTTQFFTYLGEDDTYLLDSATDFNGDADTTDGLEVVIQANNTNDGFDVVGIQTGFNESGAEVTAVDPVVAIVLDTGRSLSMWSNQLGGNVNYVEGSDAITVYSRSYVNGSEDGTNELFEGGTTANLTCVERCLRADITDTHLGTWEGVFEGGDSSAAVGYDFSQTTLTLTDNGGSNAIGLDSGVDEEDLESSQWSWGVETGPMIPTADYTNAADFYADIESGSITEFYVWETGLNEWQQNVVLLDSDDNIVEFDAPISMQYVHEQVNDRNGDVDNVGSVFLLEYGGTGQLWGIPSAYSEEDGFWSPLLSLTDGTIVGSSNEYIVKAFQVEQQMAEASSLSACSALSLTAPEELVPTDIVQDGVFLLGSVPDVSDQPPVAIDGVLVQ